MGNFNWTIFLHAGYVAFVYALIAWGATYYRQILDDLDVREAVHLGEDLYFASDPLGVLIILVLCVFFLTFAALALYVFPLEVRYYVIPLAFLVNIAQLVYRYYRQRFAIKTHGLVGRSIFLEARYRVIPYRAVKKVEYLHDMFWSVLILHFYDADGHRGDLVELRRRFTRRSLGRILRTLEVHTGLQAEERQKPARPFIDLHTQNDEREYL